MKTIQIANRGKSEFDIYVDGKWIMGDMSSTVDGAPSGEYLVEYLIDKLDNLSSVVGFKLDADYSPEN